MARPEDSTEAERSSLRPLWKGALGRSPVRLWKKVTYDGCGAHDHCVECDLYLQLTGEPPQSSTEQLIKRIARAHGRPPFHWMERKLADALYREELRRGWSVDIGLLGPAAFRPEAARVLASMRPEFGRFEEAAGPL